MNRGGTILLVKLGTHQELTSIVKELKSVLPDTRLIGISTNNADTPPELEVVAHEQDLILATYEEWWTHQLFVDPQTYLKLQKKLGRLLKMADRVANEDLIGANLRNLPIGRFRDSFEDRSLLMLRHIAFWDWVLEKNKVSAVVAQNLPHNFWDAVLHSLVEVRKIPYLCFHETRPFRTSMYVYDHPNQMGNLTFGKQLIGATRERHTLIPDSAARRDVMRHQVAAGSASTDRSSGKSLSHTARSERWSYLTRDLEFLPQRVRRSVRRRVASTTANWENKSVAKERLLPSQYFLMELQVPDNATSMLKGYMYGDARELIAHVAHSLPRNWFLVIRESSRLRSRRRSRRREFWRQVAALPQVHVISASYDRDEILLGATALIELSYSSLALKAIHSHVPVVILGMTHLPEIPGVHLVPVEQSLSAKLEILAKKPPRNNQEFDDVQSHLWQWADNTKEATLEGALSSFPKHIDDPSYRKRIVHNVARVIETWFQQSRQDDVSL